METLGLRPVNLAEKRGGKSRRPKNGAGRPDWKTSGKISFKFESKKVSAKELENFTRLLSSLLAAGVPLSRALVILHKEASSPASKAKWKEVHDLVVDGMSLADAMAKSPETFRASMSRWSRRARRADFSTWCWRRSRNFNRAKRN
jgi:type II secretory pathway component PulF